MKKHFSLMAILFVVVFSCTTNEFQDSRLDVTEEILTDETFIEMFASYQDYMSKYEDFRSNHTEDQLTQLLKKEVREIRESFAILDRKYKNFDTDIRILLQSTQLPRKSIAHRRTNGSAKEWEGEQPGYPCGANNSPNCPVGSYAEASVLGCLAGCQYSELACVQSGVSFATCNAIKTSCRQTCCGDYCGSAN
jgi:hypothetical protein